MSLHKLVFDTTDAGTIVDSHSVGAHVRGGLGGAIISYHGDIGANATNDAFVPGDVTAIADSITLTGHGFFSGDKVQFTTDDTLPAPLAVLTDYWVIYVDANTIKVATSQANAELGIAVDLTDGGIGNHTITAQPYNIRALDTWVTNVVDVNIVTPMTIDTKVDGVYNGVSNVDPDNAGVIVHVRAASPADADQTKRTTGATAASDAVVAANVHGLDVNSFGMLYNGTTWDRAKGTNGVADVSDSALGNTTLVSTATILTANTAATVVAPLTNRKYLWLFNKHNKEMYIGGTGVTIADGFPLPIGSLIEMRAGAAVAVQAITGTTTPAGKELRTMQLS